MNTVDPQTINQPTDVLVKQLGESAENCEIHHEGADNISTVKTHIGMDHQEVIGAENQRLPSYEIQHTKEQVESGLGAASSNLDEGKNTEPAVSGHDEVSFTIGLCRAFKEDGQPISQLMERGPEVNKDKTLHDQTGEFYRRSLEVEYITNAGVAPKLGGSFRPVEEVKPAAAESAEPAAAGEAKEQPAAEKESASKAKSSQENVAKASQEKQQKQKNAPQQDIAKENAAVAAV